MTTLYLIRHGQAGSRDNYDQLSELGERQALLLGDYLAGQRIDFHAIYAGSLRRQQQTAWRAQERLRQSGRSIPEIITDESWNEFSLPKVYKGLVPRLKADLPEFMRDYEEMQSALMTDPHTTRGAAGRCDRAVIEAWMENRYPDFAGESWENFRRRVWSSFNHLQQREAEENLAIFTSVTPIAIWAGVALNLSNDRILRLMAALCNTSLTTIKIRSRELWLMNFNSTPHLTDPSLITLR